MGPALQVVPNTQWSPGEGLPEWCDSCGGLGSEVESPMGMGSMPIGSIPLESIAMGSAPGVSACASRSAGSPSQQIYIKNGRPLAGMNPGGGSIRNAKATSTMLAMSVRLFHLRRLKRVSQELSLAAKY